MQQAKTFNTNVQHLITVNYQRMMAFEQAAFISDNENLRNFYAARADESETYLRELCTALNVNENNVCNAQLCHYTLKNINAQKNPNSMLQFIISFEKTVINWYKKAITDIKSLPEELAAILNRQHQSVGASQTALHQL